MNSKKQIWLILLLGILNFILLTFIKYYSNQLSFADINFLKIGNFISVFQILLFIIGNGLLIFSGKKNNSGHINFLAFLSVIYIIPLVLVIIITLVNFEFSNSYFLGYPIKKIIPVIFLVVNQTLFLFVLFTLWFIYLGNNYLAYFYSSIAVIISIIILISAAFVKTFLVEDVVIFSKENKFDYGIILGAAVWSGDKPSPIFIGRIEKGAELYLNRVIKNIHLTGGNAPGELSEAKAAYNYLVENYNINPDAILIEEATSTTNEQIRFIKNNFSNSSSNFLFISDDFHLKRIEDMADFYNLNANVISSKYKLNFQKSLYYRLRESVGLVLFWFFAI